MKRRFSENKTPRLGPEAWAGLTETRAGLLAWERKMWGFWCPGCTMPGNWWPVFDTREMTSGCPVCFWHEYWVGNDAGGEGWEFVDGIRRSGTARGGFVIAKWVDNGPSLGEFPTWWSGMELLRSQERQADLGRINEEPALVSEELQHGCLG